jgi:hypothetical protein
MYSAHNLALWLWIYSSSFLLVVSAALRASSLISSANSAFDLLLFPALGIKDQSGPLLLSDILCFVLAEFSVLETEIPMSPPHNPFSYLWLLCWSEPPLFPCNKSKQIPRSAGTPGMPALPYQAAAYSGYAAVGLIKLS